jgi:hypothetical protein
MRFFPEPNSPELVPFTKAFLRVMFAHVGFEHRVADLAEVITLEFGFGETTALVWSAKERPKKFRNSAPNIRASTPAACLKPTLSCNVSTRRTLFAAIGIGWPTVSGGGLMRTPVRLMCTRYAFDLASH